MNETMVRRDSPQVGVFFGSRSPEHDVSIITGQLILAGLREIGYKPVPIYLGKQGEWFIGEKFGMIEFFQSSSYEAYLSGSDAFILDLQKSHGVLVFRKKGLLGEQIKIDLAFPALHGSYGEDGTIQGLFEMFGVPYVGCDVASSAIAIDKVLAKFLYQQFGFPTTKFCYFFDGDWRARKQALLEEIQRELRWPLFVKPSRLGSSIGISKVKTARELEFAIEVALHYDTKVLVEESVEQVRDITCAVLGGREPRPSLLQESGFSGELFDYAAKYLEGGGAQLGKAQKAIVIPATLDERMTKQIQDLAVEVFKKFGCWGNARVDFLFSESEQKAYVNEVNTLPGTLYHHLWAKSGVPLKVLLEELLDSAKARQLERRRVTTTFASSVLQKMKGAKFS